MNQTARIAPIAGTAVWLTVMERAGYRCECTRCPKHKRHEGGRCETSVPETRGPGAQDAARLIAGPANPDPARTLGTGDAGELVAWCPPCWDHAVAVARKHAQALADRSSAEGLW